MEGYALTTPISDKGASLASTATLNFLDDLKNPFGENNFHHLLILYLILPSIISVWYWPSVW